MPTWLDDIKHRMLTKSDTEIHCVKLSLKQAQMYPCGQAVSSQKAPPLPKWPQQI